MILSSCSACLPSGSLPPTSVSHGSCSNGISGSSAHTASNCRCSLRAAEFAQLCVASHCQMVRAVLQGHRSRHVGVCTSRYCGADEPAGGRRAGTAAGLCSSAAGTSDVGPSERRSRASHTASSLHTPCSGMPVQKRGRASLINTQIPLALCQVIMHTNTNRNRAVTDVARPIGSLQYISSTSMDTAGAGALLHHMRPACASQLQRNLPAMPPIRSGAMPAGAAASATGSECARCVASS